MTDIENPPIKKMSEDELTERNESLERIRLQKSEKRFGQEKLEEHNYSLEAIKNKRNETIDSLVEEKTDQIHKAFENTSAKDSTLGTKAEYFPTTENTLWQKPQEPKKEESWLKKKLNSLWKGSKKAAILGTAGVSVSTTALAEKNPSDSTKGSSIELNFKAARKIQKEKIEPGYNPVKKEGGRTYLAKVEDGSQKELPKATASAGSVETPAYINTLIKHLQNGISPEELVEKGYISPDRIEEFRKYYVAPKADVVYIEEEQEQPQEVDGPKWATMENRYWLGNRPVGDGVFEVRKSDNKSQGGTDIDIYQPAFKLKFIYPDGTPTGKYIVIPGGEVQNYLVAGTTSFKSDRAFAEAMEKYGGNSIAYAFTGKEIKDGTTLK